MRNALKPEPVVRPADPPPISPLPMLVARFLLEIFGLVGFGFLGWWAGDGGPAGGFLAAVFVIGAAAVWGIFRVRYDPPEKADQPVVVPGWVRFLIEVAFFGLAAWGLWMGASRAVSETLLTAVVILYAITWDRQRWLLRQ